MFCSYDFVPKNVLFFLFCSKNLSLSVYSPILLSEANAHVQNSTDHVLTFACDVLRNVLSDTYIFSCNCSMFPEHSNGH